MAKLVAKLTITCGIGSFIHVVNSNSKQKIMKTSSRTCLHVFFCLRFFLYSQPLKIDRHTIKKELFFIFLVLVSGDTSL